MQSESGMKSPPCEVCGESRWELRSDGEWHYTAPCYQPYAGRRADCPENGGHYEPKPETPTVVGPLVGTGNWATCLRCRDEPCDCKSRRTCCGCGDTQERTDDEWARRHDHYAVADGEDAVFCGEYITTPHPRAFVRRVRSVAVLLAD